MAVHRSELGATPELQGDIESVLRMAVGVCSTLENICLGSRDTGSVANIFNKMEIIWKTSASQSFNSAMAVSGTLCSSAESCRQPFITFYVQV